MKKLETILRRHRVSPGAISQIREAAQEYVKGGASMEDAQLTAVRDHIEELRGRQKEVLSLAAKAKRRAQGNVGR